MFLLSNAENQGENKVSASILTDVAPKCFGDAAPSIQKLIQPTF